MKKIASLLLALLMTVSVCTSALADEGAFFQPRLLGSVEQPGSYWNSGDIMRATFVASILVDLVLAGQEGYSDTLIDGAIAQDACYFSYDAAEGIITLFAFGADHTLTLVYMPSTNSCGVNYADSTIPPSSAAECMAYIDSQNGSVSYHVDGAQVYQYFEEIVEILTN